MAEWQAYCSTEPFGPAAAFWQAGMIASMIANVNRTKKSQKAFTPEDFMPKSFAAEPDEPEAGDGSQVLQMFQDMATAMRKKQPHGK